MPRHDDTTHTLPQAALDHMSDTANQNLVDHGQLPPPVNFVWDNPLTAYDVLHGTAGSADVFVFDVAANIANGTGGIGGPNDFVLGFEPGLDLIAFVNIPTG